MTRNSIDELARKRAIWALLGIIFLVVPVVVFMWYIQLREIKCDVEITNGIALVDNHEDLYGVVHTLNGEWHYAEDVYIDEEERLTLLNGSSILTLRNLPESKLNEAKGQKTYILDLVFTEDIGDTSRIAIGIPFLNTDVKVFLNGTKLETYEPFKSWLGTENEIQLFLLRDYIVNDQDTQKLVISVNENGDNYGLYKREVMISDISTFYEQMQVQDGIQNLLVGMMIICILMGWINMLILPGHNMLTSMTMFDSTLMLYFFFEVCKLPIHTYYIFSGGEYGEKVIRGVVLGLFCMTGYWGNRISSDIFDPKKEVAPKKNIIIGRVWLVGALINFIFPQYYGREAILITLIFYISTMDVVIKRINKCKANGKYTPVMKTQAYKALYVGGLLGYDIMTTNIYPRNNAILVVGYSIFFFMEFLMRANVQKETFDITRQAKKDLEKKVEERTEKLNKANENLLKLMHIDPLTNAYNRLYFESTLLDEIEDNKDKVNYHLCLFDLDNFKSINDTYGHQIGDEQLVEAVESVKRAINEHGVISRIGGEEFVILFKDMEDLEVVLMVENVRLALEKLSEKEGRTTGSFGVTKYRREDSRKATFIRVDQCLYHSKNNGKNCITYEFDERKIYDNKLEII